jgi:integrase
MRDNKKSFSIDRGLRVFRQAFGKGGESDLTDNWYIAFRWAMKEHRVPGFSDRGQTIDMARTLWRLVKCREAGAMVDAQLTAWAESAPDSVRKKLVSLGIMDPLTIVAGKPLADHLADWKMSIVARGSTADHAAVRHARVTRVFNGCGLFTWNDLSKPGSGSAIEAFLSDLRTRDKKNITGQSVNYYVSAVKGFCNWMVKDNRAQVSPMTRLQGVGDVNADRKRERRHLGVEELQRLVTVTGKQPYRFQMTAADRSLLYRFAFETGLRPKQIRGLTLESFDLDGEPATVTAAAKTVKRRRRHTQPLSPQMVADLKEHFATKMPAAPAFVLPRSERMVKMFRSDLLAAREAWIKEGKGDAEQGKRRRSDFLASKDRNGLHAVFYSLRHSTGSIMAERGVPQQTIKTMLNHTRSSTTDRYMHTDENALATAIATLPNLSGAKQKRRKVNAG